MGWVYAHRYTWGVPDWPRWATWHGWCSMRVANAREQADRPQGRLAQASCRRLVEPRARVPSLDASVSEGHAPSFPLVPLVPTEIVGGWKNSGFSNGRWGGNCARDVGRVSLGTFCDAI